MEDTKKKIILFVQGGAGDVLAHTPMIRSMRKHYPDDEIIVLSTYSQLLEGNKNINTVIPLRDLKDFYDVHVLNAPVRFYRKRFIYDYLREKEDYALGGKTLPEFICHCYGTDYDGGPLDYTVNAYEQKLAKTFMSQFKKPVVLLHAVTAIPSDGNFNKTGPIKDLNQALLSALIEKYKERFDFCQIGLVGEPLVKGAIDILGMPMRDAIAIIPLARSYIFAESLFAHVTSALGTTGIVLFNNTSPFFFGYQNNLNVYDAGTCPIWPCNRPIESALLDVLPGYRDVKSRAPVGWECPNQVCNKQSFELLEKAFLTSVTPQVNPGLNAARNTPPQSAPVIEATKISEEALP